MAIDIQAMTSAVNAQLGKKKKVTEPKKTAGRPVGTTVGTGSMQPQYPALRDEVTADHPITELSPEVQQLMAKAGKVASDQLSGVISADVQAQVQRISAENAIRGGLGMSSQAARNLTARDLGLTSMDIQQRGLEAAQNLASFDANLMGQRMDFMAKMRGMDLDVNQMKLQNKQFNKELQLNRFKLLSDNLMNYYQLSFGYSQSKKADAGALESLRRDTEALTGDLRKRWGLK